MSSVWNEARPGSRRRARWPRRRDRARNHLGSARAQGACRLRLRRAPRAGGRAASGAPQKPAGRSHHSGRFRRGGGRRACGDAARGGRGGLESRRARRSLDRGRRGLRILPGTFGMEPVPGAAHRRRARFRIRRARRADALARAHLAGTGNALLAARGPLARGRPGRRARRADSRRRQGALARRRGEAAAGYRLRLRDACHGRRGPARRLDRLRGAGGAAPAEALGRSSPWRPAAALRVPRGKPACSRRYARAHGGGARRAPGRRSHRDDRRARAAVPPREAALMLQAAGIGLSAGERELVRALDLSLAPGAFWSLLGRNGSGKTSLILALAGLRSPQAGTIALDGVALAAHRRGELARRIAVLLQDEETDFWGSVLDYVMLGRYPLSRSAWGRDEEGAGLARRRLAELDLADRAAQGYRTLSGGERQRARIAQVLLQDADILLLDEPLQHLDLNHQAQVMRTLSRCASGGKTVLAALHEPGHAARHCGFAVLLYDAGRASLGRSSDMLTQANLEALYQCRLEAAGTGSLLPS